MYNVMIVEDEVYGLELLMDTINWHKYGFHIAETAINGYQGYNKFVTGNFDIIISDIRMPIMSGIEMAEKIRNIDDNVEIIFISSYEEFEYAKKAIDTNVVGYVLKQFKDEEIIRVLNIAAERIKRKNATTPTVRKEETQEISSNENHIIENVKEFIKSNIKEKFVLKDVAEHFMYSPNYLGKLFKQSTGMYFNDYVTYEKMEKAKQLLKMPQNQIGDVAEQLGYGQIAYFTKQFKEYYGITPKAFRGKF